MTEVLKVNAEIRPALSEHVPWITDNALKGSPRVTEDHPYRSSHLRSSKFLKHMLLQWLSFLSKLNWREGPQFGTGTMKEAQSKNLVVPNKKWTAETVFSVGVPGGPLSSNRRQGCRDASFQSLTCVNVRILLPFLNYCG